MDTCTYCKYKVSKFEITNGINGLYLHGDSQSGLIVLGMWIKYTLLIEWNVSPMFSLKIKITIS